MPLAVSLALACGEPRAGDDPSAALSLPPGAQAISLLGDTLYAPELPPEVLADREAQLAEARADYEADPANADALIWYGRRTAYLGDYRTAIAIYSEGIEKHPTDPRLYRHRGHRYISVRRFDAAIADLERAASMIAGREDEIEPDGMPTSDWLTT
jgi:tetratricopeptide (TPR) repeat protein